MKDFNSANPEPKQISTPKSVPVKMSGFTRVVKSCKATLLFLAI